MHLPRDHLIEMMNALIHVAPALCVTLAMASGPAYASDERVRFDVIDTNMNGLISPMEMALWRMTKFASRDLNEDGIITRDELLQEARDGARPMEWSEASDFILNFDDNADLSVTFVEVFLAMDRSDFFGIIDHDASGGITRQEADGWLNVAPQADQPKSTAPSKPSTPQLIPGTVTGPHVKPDPTIVY
jgi:hypothetical protein